MPNTTIEDKSVDSGDSLKQEAVNALSSLDEADQIKVLEYITSLVNYTKNSNVGRPRQ